MDRRLAERRRRVAEDRARSNLGRLVRLLIILGVVGGLVWFAQSPFLSVATVEATGHTRVDVDAVLTAHGVVEGRPMLVIDVGGAEAALQSDPWVDQARVAREWPTRVVVQVVEREPAATAELADGSWLVAADGTLLETTPEETRGQPVASFPSLTSEAAVDDLELEAAVEYLAALPGELRRGARVGDGPEGLEATVAGFTVRLGRPFDMEQKATVTAAMIESGVEEGSVITVVAPASPALLPPGADPATQESEEPTTTTTQP